MSDYRNRNSQKSPDYYYSDLKANVNNGSNQQPTNEMNGKNYYNKNSNNSSSNLNSKSTTTINNNNNNNNINNSLNASNNLNNSSRVNLNGPSTTQYPYANQTGDDSDYEKPNKLSARNPANNNNNKNKNKNNSNRQLSRDSLEME